MMKSVGSVLLAASVLSCATVGSGSRSSREAWQDQMYQPFAVTPYQALVGEPIDPDEFDSALVGAAIWKETNAVRAKHGLRPLGYCPECRVAAQRYTDDMVSGGFF